MAAVLARGDGALLSHRSAAALWGFAPAAAPRIDVTAGRTRHGQPGIALHHVRSLHPADCAARDHIPLTTVARTLLDLSEVVSPRQLERAFEEAERLQLLAGRFPRRAQSSSECSSTFAATPDCPPPAVNVSVAGFEVDAVWPDRGLVVELDGYAFHRTRAAFERDRVRDAKLQLAGLRGCV